MAAAVAPAAWALRMSHAPAVVELAVAVPLGVAVYGAVIWLIHRRGVFGLVTPLRQFGGGGPRAGRALPRFLERARRSRYYQWMSSVYELRFATRVRDPMIIAGRLTPRGGGRIPLWGATGGG